MKKHKNLLIASLFLLAFIVSIPTTTFAKNDDNNNRFKNKVKVEQSTEVNFKNSLHFRNNYNAFVKRTSNLFDWFQRKIVNAKEKIETEINRAPIISSISAPTVLKVGEKGEWKIKAYDPENSNLTYEVRWGDEKELQALETKRLSTEVQTGTFTHIYYEEGKYKVKFIVTDEAGIKNVSTVTVRVVEEDNEDEDRAPIISRVKSTEISQTAALIKWKTDIKANSYIWYGTNPDLDLSKDPIIKDSKNKTEHNFKLQNLNPNTKYYFVVGSSNDGELTTSNERSFTTKELENSSTPVIKSITGDKDILVGETTTITIKSYDPKNENLTYGVDWGDTSILSNVLQKTSPVFVQTSTMSHAYTEAGTYTATFTIRNESGKETSSSIKIEVKEKEDTTAPVISKIEKRINDSGVQISWETNEESTSSIFYGTEESIDIDSTNTAKIEDKTLKTDHSLSISGLASDTLYHFIIKSVDASNNVALSSESTFVTNN
ncbi:MAG: PKD domain-containing protein [Candidatus Pacebacteria bacterium]|nr:PKD domain-containing protein [Candidatus Paceibacterota bacterium]